VVVGGGFAGIAAACALRDAPVRVTVLDRRNHHLFRPLLYQVATSVLSPGEMATPICALLRPSGRPGYAKVRLVHLEAVRAAAVAEHGAIEAGSELDRLGFGSGRSNRPAMRRPSISDEREKSSGLHAA
jgi:glycine/D-amino acid oxidase-like deaminating enzyme